MKITAQKRELEVFKGTENPFFFVYFDVGCLLRCFAEWNGARARIRASKSATCSAFFVAFATSKSRRAQLCYFTVAKNGILRNLSLFCVDLIFLHTLILQNISKSFEFFVAF